MTFEFSSVVTSLMMLSISMLRSSDIFCTFCRRVSLSFRSEMRDASNSNFSSDSNVSVAFASNSSTLAFVSLYFSIHSTDSDGVASSCSRKAAASSRRTAISSPPSIPEFLPLLDRKVIRLSLHLRISVSCCNFLFSKFTCNSRRSLTSPKTSTFLLNFEF